VILNEKEAAGAAEAARKPAEKDQAARYDLMHVRDADQREVKHTLYEDPCCGFLK